MTTDLDDLNEQVFKDLLHAAEAYRAAADRLAEEAGWVRRGLTEALQAAGLGYKPNELGALQATGPGFDTAVGRLALAHDWYTRALGLADLVGGEHAYRDFAVAAVAAARRKLAGLA
jgi:hypothetical protein